MRVAALVVAAGCGRFGFDGQLHDGALDDRGASVTDSSVDSGQGGIDSASPGAPACLPAYSVCDGFEGGTIDTTTWTIDPMITIDTTRAHRGAASVRVHTPAFGAGQDSYTTLDETKTIAGGATTIWVRAWLWLSALPAGQNGMEVISAVRPGALGDHVFVFSDSTHIYSQYANMSRTAMVTVPVGTWFCMVWKVVRSTTTAGSLELTGDVPLLMLNNLRTDSAGSPMTVVRVGVGFSGSNVPIAQPALDLWVDDVIVHTSAITCSD